MWRVLTRFGTLLLLLVLASLAGCAISPERAKWREKSHALLAVQEQDAQRANAVGGTRKVLYAAFALGSGSAAFQGDALLVREALRSANPQLSVLLLSNKPEHDDISYPFATKHNVKRVLSGIARMANEGTLVVVLLTSHGIPNWLGIHIGQHGYFGEYVEYMSSQELRSYFDELRSIPTIILISACFSGSFVPDLAGENRIIITATSKDRPSFGCAPASRATYFIEEFFQHNFDASRSLSELFLQARRQVAERERRERYPPSEPQMFVGERMKGSAAVPLRELLTTRQGAP
jgi:hypothetical protein